MADQIFFEDVREGDELPPLEKHPTTTQLVQWAAAVGDFYPLHYDKDFANRAGQATVVIHGPLKHAFMADMLCRWMGPHGRIKRWAASYRGIDGPDGTFIVKGRVAKKSQEGGENRVELEVWGENGQGEKTTPGSATVILPSRG